MIPTLQLGGLGRAMRAISGGGGGGAIYSNDGSTLSGWTNSGITIDPLSGSPAPCFRAASSGKYAYLEVAGARRWKLKMAASTSSLVHFQFGCSSAGVGPQIRCDSRPSNPSGICTASGFNVNATAPSGGSALGSFLSANTWYEFDVRLNDDGDAVDVYLDSVLALPAVPVTIGGDYVCLAGSVLNGGVWDQLEIY